MMQEFTRLLSLRPYSVFWTLVVNCVVFLCGLALAYAMFGVDSGNYFCVGTLMALICGILLLFFQCMEYPAAFRLALSMGQTRQRFLGGYGLLLLAQILLSYGLILLMYRVETALYPGVELEMDFSFLTDFRLVLPVMALVWSMILFLGAFSTRFGSKFLWIPYVLWLAGMNLMSRLMDETAENGALSAIADRIGGGILAIPTGGWAALALAAAAVFCAFALHLALRQEVRSA